MRYQGLSLNGRRTAPHAQFEILHPFKDGNGRIGRMLIPLLLFNRRSLARPMFYLSEFLEANRDEYYDRLLNVTDNNEWQGWISFFARAIVSQAETNLAKVKEMLDLYNELKASFTEATRSQFAISALDAFFRRPIINATSFQESAGLRNRITSNSMLRQLTERELIVGIREGSGPKAAVYGLPRLINIAEGRKVL